MSKYIPGLQSKGKNKIKGKSLCTGGLSFPVKKQIHKNLYHEVSQMMSEKRITIHSFVKPCI